jgi:hypothetical protein
MRETLIKNRIPEINSICQLWKVRLVDYPVLACSEGHEKREVYPDFNVFWSDEFTNKKELWSKSNGFFRKRNNCTICEQPLEVQDHDGFCSVKLQQNKPDNFTIEVIGLLSTCTACHAKQIKANISLM